MNIQIFGKSKCFDTKKAERYFKERGIRYQWVDLLRYGMSRGELDSVIKSVGLDGMVDQRAKGAEVLRYLAREEDKTSRLLEEPGLLKTPIVRNGRKATVGYRPETWKQWE